MSDETDSPAPRASTVYVCTNLRMSGASCAGQESKAVLHAMQRRADERALMGHPMVTVRSSVCMGYCGDGPNVKVINGDFYHQVGLDDIDAILDEAEKPKRD